MESRERRALRVLARLAVVVVAVPAGLVGLGYVVQLGQMYRQHRLHDDRAHRILDRWDAALAAGTADTAERRFVPAGELTGQDGDWEPEVGENDKLALIAGAVTLDAGATLPAAPVTGTVRWADGVSADVPLLGPEEAVDALRKAVPPAAADCRGCRPLVVTGAVLGLSEVTTDRGRATVPTWRYTVDGTAVVVYWQDVGLLAGGLVGRPTTVACAAYAVSRTVDVRLDAPLGDRTVLDLSSGVPLPGGLPRPPA